MLIALDTIFQFAKLMGGGHGGPKPFFDPASAPASLLKPGLLGSHPLLQVQYSTVQRSTVRYSTVHYEPPSPAAGLLPAAGPGPARRLQRGPQPLHGGAGQVRGQ